MQARSAYDLTLARRPLRRLQETLSPPRELDPLHGLPAEEIYARYATLIVRVPRRYQKRAFDHGEQQRPGHSHAIVTLTHPRKDEINAAFGPKEPIDFARFANWPDVTKLAVPAIWQHHEGAITDERHFLHDLARVYILTREDQYRRAKAEIIRWIRNPPPYQVTGYTAPNCARFAFAAMQSADLYVPPQWYATPWPHVIADDIEKQGRMKVQDPLIRNITAAITLETFTQNQQRLCIPEPKRIIPVTPSVSANRKLLSAAPQAA